MFKNRPFSPHPTPQKKKKRYRLGPHNLKQITLRQHSRQLKNPFQCHRRKVAQERVIQTSRSNGEKKRTHLRGFAPFRLLCAKMQKAEVALRACLRQQHFCRNREFTGNLPESQCGSAQRERKEERFKNKNKNQIRTLISTNAPKEQIGWQNTDSHLKK